MLERSNDLAQDTSDAVATAVRLAADRWASLTSDLPSGRELAAEASTALTRTFDQTAKREARRRQRMVGSLILGGIAAGLLIAWLVRRQTARNTAQAEARRLDREDLERAKSEGMGGAIGARPVTPVPMDMSAPDEDRPHTDALDELDARKGETVLDRAANGLSLAPRR